MSLSGVPFRRHDVLHRVEGHPTETQKSGHRGIQATGDIHAKHCDHFSR